MCELVKSVKKDECDVLYSCLLLPFYTDSVFLFRDFLANFLRIFFMTHSWTEKTHTCNSNISVSFWELMNERYQFSFLKRCLKNDESMWWRQSWIWKTARCLHAYFLTPNVILSKILIWKSHFWHENSNWFISHENYAFWREN